MKGYWAKVRTHEFLWGGVTKQKSHALMSYPERFLSWREHSWVSLRRGNWTKESHTHELSWKVIELKRALMSFCIRVYWTKFSGCSKSHWQKASLPALWAAVNAWERLNLYGFMFSFFLKIHEMVDFGIFNSTEASSNDAIGFSMKKSWMDWIFSKSDLSAPFTCIGCLGLELEAFAEAIPFFWNLSKTLLI